MSNLHEKKRAKSLVESRNKNLRQLLLRATRTLNALVEEELAKRGYENIRLSHNALLSNLDVEGNSVTTVAERAGIAKQAMGGLADELEELGYISCGTDPSDARTRLLTLTDEGYKLMVDTFKIVESIEDKYANILGEQTMDDLRTGLAAFIGVRQLS